MWSWHALPHVRQISVQKYGLQKNFSFNNKIQHCHLKFYDQMILIKSSVKMKKWKIKKITYLGKTKNIANWSIHFFVLFLFYFFNNNWGTTNEGEKITEKWCAFNLKKCHQKTIFSKTILNSTMQFKRNKICCCFYYLLYLPKSGFLFAEICIFVLVLKQKMTITLILYLKTKF